MEQYGLYEKILNFISLLMYFQKLRGNFKESSYCGVEQDLCLRVCGHMVSAVVTKCANKDI